MFILASKDNLIWYILTSTNFAHKQLKYFSYLVHIFISHLTVDEKTVKHIKISGILSYFVDLSAQCNICVSCSVFYV